MTTVAHPARAAVDAAMDTLFHNEPGSQVDTWRPAYDILSEGLDRARSIRELTRFCVIGIVGLAAIAMVLASGATPSTTELQYRSELTPMMMSVRAIPAEIQGFLLAVTLGAIAVEFALARIFPVLANEESIVSLLRYYGSNVQDDETTL